MIISAIINNIRFVIMALILYSKL